MKTLFTLTKRNIKLFFKDKGMFFTSLITPAILLVLYVTFLGKIYRNSFLDGLPKGVVVSKKVINGIVAGQLISSILSVSCITVAFCSNFLMVNDKVSGAIKDFTVSPLKSKTLSLSYYVATFFSTLIICFVALSLCLIYVAIVGWYISVVDILLIIVDIILLVLFGTAISSIINYFLSSQGQISAVGTIVSSCYGFICGAYMPISSFSSWLKNVILFLPGTYGTSLFRNHLMQGAFSQLKTQGVSSDTIRSLKNATDCNLYFFGNNVNIPSMYLILGLSVIVLIAVYVLINATKKAKK